MRTCAIIHPLHLELETAEQFMRTQAHYDETLSTRNTVSQLSEAGPDRTNRLKDEGRRRDPARQERLA